MSARTSTPTPIPLFYRTLATSMGPMVAMAEERGLVLLEFEDRPALPPEVDQLRHQYHYQPVPGAHPHLEHIERELRAYFAGELRGFQVPLEAPGTPFERAVWSGLLTIPYAETRSYGQMATQLGRPGASRAVGLANGRNRIAIVIPCHRVIGADGSLVGYGGGKHRKERLLRLESSVAGAVGGGAGQLALGFGAQPG